MAEKYVVTVKIERVERDEVPMSICRCSQKPCHHGQVKVPAGDRKVDTVASIVVTSDTIIAAGMKAKAHIDAELDHAPAQGTVATCA